MAETGSKREIEASLEEVTQAFVDAISQKRDAEWKMGDLLLARPFVVGADWPAHFAGVAKCTKKRILELAAMAARFPPDQRDPEHSWLWHRGVSRYALATGITPAAARHQALAEDWSAADLARKARPVERVKFSGECGECGFQVRVSCTKEGISVFKGQPLCCPVCTIVHGEGGLVRARYKEPIGKLVAG